MYYDTLGIIVRFIMRAISVNLPQANHQNGSSKRGCWAVGSRVRSWKANISIVFFSLLCSEYILGVGVRVLSYPLTEWAE